MARKRRTPRRGAHGRFIKAASNPRRTRRRTHRAAAPRRRVRRYTRRNAYLANPRRSHRRRSYRRNPPLFGSGEVMGIKFTDIAYAGAGFLGTPLIEGFINGSGIIPVSMRTSKLTSYAIKAATVFGLSWAGSKFISREAGKYIAIGGITWIVANLAIDFIPQVFSGASMGYMSPGANVGAFPRRMGAGPLLGKYPGMGMYQGIGVTPAKLPERVDPNSRF